MTDPDASQLLESLANARWHVVSKTYGSSHATLIGIVVDWWISQEGNDRSALEGGPSNAPSGNGMIGCGVCDALLCEDGVPIAVLEVEGMRKEWVVDKVDKFFRAPYSELNTLQFAVLVFYSYRPIGRVSAKSYPPSIPGNVVKKIEAAAKNHPTKTIVVVGIEKEYDPKVTGIRTRNMYYSGYVQSISGSVYANGERIHSRSLWSPRSNR